jgi:PleD family two-component response regulator
MKNTVIAAVDDMIFAAKIRAVAESLNLDVRFAKSPTAILAAAREAKPTLIIFDLHSQKCDPFATATLIKADEELCTIKLLGFYSHVQTALRDGANDAGFESVLPRSAFTKRLAEILKEAYKD